MIKISPAVISHQKEYHEPNSDIIIGLNRWHDSTVVKSQIVALHRY